LSAVVVAIFLSVPYFKKTYFSKVKIDKNKGNGNKNETIDEEGSATDKIIEEVKEND
jgi:hypothetical protein